MDDDYMKRQLPKWLRAVEIQSASPRLAAIESSASRLAQTLSGRGVLDMTLLAHGRSHGNAFDQLSESLQEDDPTFGCLADDLETRIAASTTVCALLAERSTSASIAAQGVLSAQWLGLSPAVAELPALAVDTSRRRSELFRNRAALPEVSAQTDFFKGVPQFDTEEETVTHQDIKPLRAATKALANELQMQQYSYARVLAARLDAADEEVEILWWAFSGYSERAKRGWTELAHPEAALLCGIELGDKLKFEIELPSTEALLARLLGPSIKESIALASAVEAGASFLGSMELPEDGHPLLPILDCVSEHRALQGDSSWQGSVARWSIDAEHATEKVAFARQAVLETSLMGKVCDGGSTAR